MSTVAPEGLMVPPVPAVAVIVKVFREAVTARAWSVFMTTVPEEAMGVPSRVTARLP